MIAAGEPAALGIITGIKGSSPQKIGAKALFLADGRIIGTLGGGCLEAEIQDRARRALQTGKPATFELVLDHDFGWDDGLICGGQVRGVILPEVTSGEKIWRRLAQRNETLQWGVRENFAVDWVHSAGSWRYEETVRPPCALWIAGAGHIAQAVAPWAQELDFTVTVFDDRPALVNHQFFPAGIRLRADAWERLLSDPKPKVPTFGLIVTRGHRHDALVLRAWIGQGFAFLGMIGSRRKARTIRDYFVKEKLATAEQMEAVACPVGVEIGEQTVREIAFSILAQYIQKRSEVLDENRISDSGRAGQPGAELDGGGSSPGSTARTALV